MKTEYIKYFVIILLIIYFQIATNKYLCACECEKQIKRQKDEGRSQNKKTNQTEINIERRTLNIEQGNNRDLIVRKAQVIYPEEYKDKKFVGADKCKMCHSIEYRKWQGTKHARAYEKIEKQYNEQKSEFRSQESEGKRNVANGFSHVKKGNHNIKDITNCELCHTTGYGYKYGFSDKQISHELAGVQCEVCHGPGGVHSQKPGQIKMAFGEKPIEESLCRSCHREEAGMGFVFGEYVNKIVCKDRYLLK